MFTDLHCHLLPDLDDGARDLDEAVAMARALVACGFSAAAPSPHAGRGYPGGPKAHERLEQLREELGRQQIGLELFPGAENYLDAELLENELAGRGRHVNDTRYLLVETPYETVVPALPDVIFKLRRKGIHPVFAHPERCAEFQEKGRAEAAVNAGALLQLNLGSLWGRYGRAVRKTALRLLAAGLYSVAASDLHDSEDAERWLGLAIKQLQSEAGGPAARRLLEENPQHLVRGEELAE